MRHSDGNGTIFGVKVMLDRDLAKLNEAERRILKRLEKHWRGRFWIICYFILNPVCGFEVYEVYDLDTDMLSLY